MISYIIIIVISIIAFKQYIQRRILKKQIVGINGKLNEIMNEKDFKYLLYNTEEEELTALLSSINKLIKKEKEERYIRINNEKVMDEMLCNLSHDVRTPLTIIQGYVEYIRLNYKKEKEEEDILKLLDKKICEVVNFVNSFFTLSKLESGDDKLTLEKVNINNILRENILNHYNELNKANLEVEINIPNEKIFIMADINAVNRVLNNLVSNVIKYGIDGKYLGINLFRNENEVVIQIIDKGQGIDENDINNIFKRRYTAKRIQSNNLNSSGLGLRITKILVSAMNGDIEVQSIPYIKTIFTIKFPNLINSK